MDIRNWPLNRIMQLPDCCFGRRWSVFCGVTTESAVDKYAIVGAGVPDRAVIWELMACSPAAWTAEIGIEFAWADALVTTRAQWSALQKMFPCQGIQDGVDFGLWGCSSGDIVMRRLKLPSPAAGLKPTIRLDEDSTIDKRVCAIFVISSIPTEVPDWLCSAHL